MHPTLTPPPGSFYFLATAADLETTSLTNGNTAITVKIGIWHLLPSHWRSPAEQMEQRTNRDWTSPYKVTLWPTSLTDEQAAA